jgi:SAM-dependent methyltransferase
VSLADTNLLYREPWLYDQLSSGDSRAGLLISLIDRFGPPQASNLLDLGCGTGRDLADLTVAAPRLGTVGIDVQPGMVEHGRRTHPQLDLRVGDLRTVRLGRPFDVITSLGNTLAYLHTDADLDAAFATMEAHAHDRTLVIVQTMVGAPNTGPPRTASVVIGDTEIQVATSTRFDAASRMATTDRVWELPDGRRAADHLRRRILDADELRQRLDRAGFVLELLATDPIDPSKADAPVRYAVATRGV